MKPLAAVGLTIGIIVVAAVAIVMVAKGGSETTVAAKAGKPTVMAALKPNRTAVLFQPPSEQDMPKDELGQVVKMGRDIFQQSALYASPYVGKTNLRCASCHLDAGLLAHSAPLWAAYVSYSAYRSKNKHVNTSIRKDRTDWPRKWQSVLRTCKECPR